MNTLSRAITAQLFTDTNTYAALCAHWHALVCSDRKHELEAAHHLLYLALRGKDWRKGFTPPSNPRKLANGAFVGWALFRALRTLHSQVAEPKVLAPFAGLVTPQMLRQLQTHLPLLDPAAYRPEDFSPGNLSVAAYLTPAGVEEPAHG